MRKIIYIILFLTANILFITNVVAGTDKISTFDTQRILANAPELSPEALKYALSGYLWTLKNRQVSNPNVLTVIDFTQPSYIRRLFVINLKNSKVLMRLYTTHGVNSGVTYATKFSSKWNSGMTSLGAYLTLNSYYGEHGLSLRIEGLEKGINDNAYIRNVVIHPAIYATSDFINTYHRAGRSLGCIAVDPAKSKQLIELIKNGSVIFAYAKPEQHDPRVILAAKT